MLWIGRTQEEGRCPGEKVVGDAQYADGLTRGGYSRRGRQHLSLLRRLLARDDDPYGTLLTACANRAHDDYSAPDNRGADYSAPDNRRADYSAPNDP